MSFIDKVALVTGATSGIGTATATVLAQRGAHVIVTGRDAARGQALVAKILRDGGTANFIKGDLGNAGNVRKLASMAIDLRGRVDILVNNAAVAAFGATPDIGESTFDDIYAVNVKAPFFLVGSLAPAMAERGSGVIINVTTMVAGFGAAGSAVYASSKAALNLLTKTWAAEYGPRGVRVNAVSPGPTHTEGTERQYGLAALTRLASRAPAGRVADPAEIATTIAFVASDDAAFIHGAILAVDGGRSAV